MTLEEKANLMVGMRMNFPAAPPANQQAVRQSFDRVPGAAGSTYAIPRLTIPPIVIADGPAGPRIGPIRQNTAVKPTMPPPSPSPACSHRPVTPRGLARSVATSGFAPNETLEQSCQDYLKESAAKLPRPANPFSLRPPLRRCPCPHRCGPDYPSGWTSP